MQVTFKPASDIVYFVDTQDPPASWGHMHQELENLGWRSEPTIGDQDQFAVMCLATYCAPYDTQLSVFQKHFTADFKQRLLSLLFDNEEFCMAWGNPQREYFDSLTELQCNWVATPARYCKHPWHIDSRNQVAFGMIYFTHEDNALHSTWFDTGQHGHLLRAPSAPGQGWMIINTDRARHCGMNDTDQVRYSFKFSLDLKTKKTS